MSFSNYSSSDSDRVIRKQSSVGNKLPLFWGEAEEQKSVSTTIPIEKPLNLCKKRICKGDAIPYNVRLFDRGATEDTTLMGRNYEHLVRVMDLGYKKRIIIVGVIGSFTPDCWNRHLYLMVKHYDYLMARGVSRVCCVATNDGYVHETWGRKIGIADKVSMLADVTTEFTQALGLDMIVPWLGPTIRSRRYIMQVDNLIVRHLVLAPDCGVDVKWDCDHLLPLEPSFGEEDGNN